MRTVRASERIVAPPGRSTFRSTRSQRRRTVTPLGTRTVTVAESQLGGMPGWVDRRARDGYRGADARLASWLTRADLAPERWVATIGNAQMAASFIAGLVFGAIQSYQGRASFVLGVSRQPAAQRMTERLFELLPLRGLSCAASLLLLDGGTPARLPAELLVEREERRGRRRTTWLLGGGRCGPGAIEAALWVSRAMGPRRADGAGRAGGARGG